LRNQTSTFLILADMLAKRQLLIQPLKISLSFVSLSFDDNGLFFGLPF
jgi:hypothetical protein